MPTIRLTIPLPPFSELRRFRRRWTWQEIKWGKCSGLLQAEDAVAYALALLDEDRPDFAELLALALEDPSSWKVDERITALCALEEAESDERMLLRWRRAILAWLDDHEADEKRLQEQIEVLYADFGHPEDMAPMIGYMPQSFSWPPKAWNVRKRLKAYLASPGESAEESRG